MVATRAPSIAAATARFRAVDVFETPPFGDVIKTIR